MPCCSPSTATRWGIPRFRSQFRPYVNGKTNPIRVPIPTTCASIAVPRRRLPSARTGPPPELPIVRRRHVPIWRRPGHRPLIARSRSSTESVTSAPAARPTISIAAGGTKAHAALPGDEASHPAIGGERSIGFAEPKLRDQGRHKRGGRGAKQGIDRNERHAPRRTRASRIAPAELMPNHPTNATMHPNRTSTAL